MFSEEIDKSTIEEITAKIVGVNQLRSGYDKRVNEFNHRDELY